MKESLYWGLTPSPKPRTMQKGIDYLVCFIVLLKWGRKVNIFVGLANAINKDTNVNPFFKTAPNRKIWERIY